MLWIIKIPLLAPQKNSFPKSSMSKQPRARPQAYSPRIINKTKAPLLNRRTREPHSPTDLPTPLRGHLVGGVCKGSAAERCCRSSSLLSPRALGRRHATLHTFDESTPLLPFFPRPCGRFPRYLSLLSLFTACLFVCCWVAYPEYLWVQIFLGHFHE